MRKFSPIALRAFAYFAKVVARGEGWVPHPTVFRAGGRVLIPKNVFGWPILAGFKGGVFSLVPFLYFLVGR
jgi:hypothetical protein